MPAAESGLIEQIDWPSPPLGEGPFEIESLVPEHRHLRVVVVARLEQPWSIAWLPDGAALVTERPGRLRLIRNGALVQAPVAGLPDIHADGLSYQGLMDVVLHPRFGDNRFVYLSYHRPARVQAEAVGDHAAAGSGCEPGRHAAHRRNDGRAWRVERNSTDRREGHLSLGRDVHRCGTYGVRP